MTKRSSFLQVLWFLVGGLVMLNCPKGVNDTLSWTGIPFQGVFQCVLKDRLQLHHDYGHDDKVLTENE